MDKDTELNIFARWFGNMLVELKNHDLRLKKQPWSPDAYAKKSELDKIVHIG